MWQLHSHAEKNAQAHPTPALNHLYVTASHAASEGSASTVIFSGQLRAGAYVGEFCAACVLQLSGHDVP